VDGSTVPITGSYTFSNVQANHTISVTSIVNGELNPIQITNLQLPLIATQSGFVMPINVTITNPDSLSAIGNIQLSADSILLFSSNVTLNALQTETIPCFFNASVLAVGSYTCSVSLNTTNLSQPNTEIAMGQIGVTYPGDLDGNFKVDYNDLATFVHDYLLYYYSNQYTPSIDYNQDGKINFKDLELFVQYYILYGSTL
jgi:hypothetical protein